jgi:hypothetical protein
MEISTRDRDDILKAIERALWECDQAMTPEKRDSFGYAYSSGYATSTLKSIASMLGKTL